MRLELIASLCGLAAASPWPVGYGFCATVSKQIGSNHYQSPVTAYCSSYLSIPVHTKTARRSYTTTVTKVEASPSCSTTVILPQSTSTATITTGKVVATTTFSTTTTITDISTSTSTTTIEVCQVPFAQSDGQERKRSAPQYGRYPKPAALSAYKDKTAISSACSCLTILTSTTTVYKGATTYTSTTTISKRAKGTVPTISPQPLTVTSTVTTDSTSSTTTTVTTRVDGGSTLTTTTVQAIQTPPIFSLGAYNVDASFNGDYFTSNTENVDSVVQFKSLADDRAPIKFELRRGGVLRGVDLQAIVGTSSDTPPRLKFVEETDLACSVQIRDDSMCQLNCQRNGVQQTNYVCAGQAWRVGTGSVVPDGCVAFTPLVESWVCVSCRLAG